MSFLDRFIHGDENAHAEENEWRRISNWLHRNVDEYKMKHPEQVEFIDTALITLDDLVRRRYRRTRVEGNSRPPRDALTHFFLTPDRMSAYACVLPPADGGADITKEKVLSDLSYAGISYGIMEERVSELYGANPYLRIIPIAEGTPPRDGEDGQIEALFEQQIETKLEVATNERIDFNKTHLIQTVHEGDPIYRIIPPVPGQDGVDVTGMTVPCQQAEEIQIPIGRHTKLSPDGRSLLAEIDGILYVTATQGDAVEYSVRPQRLFAGDLSSFAGVLHIEDSLYVPGNVFGGVNIEAGGDVIITGEVRDATIVSIAGTVRVQKGIRGVEGKTTVKARNQVQALVIESASVTSGGDVISETILDSEISCGGAVSVTGGRGIILGGHIHAEKLVSCQQIGNLSGKRTKITVGLTIENAADRDRIQKGLVETRNTLDKLWGNISTLRKLGSRATQEQKELLEQLVEQRSLYEQQEKQLKADWKELMKTLKAAQHGHVYCAQLYPVTEVQIGLHRQEFTLAETGCNIHIYGETLATH